MFSKTITNSKLNEISEYAKKVWIEFQSKYRSENNIQKKVSDLVNEISVELKTLNKH